jgi:ABC-type uncharacterized transport system substrate-binding protein
MRLSLSAFLLLISLAPAVAHPHVFVTARSEIVYDQARRFVGVRHAWTFDDMFSAFATQGLDKNGDGRLSRDELQSLAQTNVDSLKDFDYFTVARLGGKKLLFKAPVDYWLEFTGGVLTLHFLLPANAPQDQGQKALALEVYDPTYYVAFDLAEDAPVSISGAPDCVANVVRPKPLDAAQQAAAVQLDQAAFSALDSNKDFGAQFAPRILVNCP